MRYDLISALAVLMALTGCSSLLVSKAPPDEVIWLDPPTLQNAGADSSAGSLRVLVDAAPGLDTDSVLVLDAGQRLRPLGSARWADHLPEVFETLAKQSVESGGSFDMVVGRHDVESADTELTLELRRFFGIADADDQVQTVVLDVSATLRCRPAADRFALSAEVDVPVASRDAVIGAYRGATDAVLAQLNEQIAGSNCSVPDYAAGGPAP